ncbi:tRNA 2-thiouridine(34) synthase MnmA [Candidatus Nomurabacteria bacterium]|nr:tRNA 2-thiouridine(34) synthase MnmA [Candidatus Nomurabacteria bacterium]MCB9820688.1 tRNA 2-thiouridine(34) synthase MnmA [Candidatus Nomurabacteria bacterium]
MKTKEKVFVGMSGGVDSSVSAYLLKKQGYDVTGVFIRTWQPDFVECTWKDERRDAMRVCAFLDIPFLELDAEEKYKEAVAMYMIDEYKAGRTPNPDVMCNREVKFGVFWDFAKEHGARYIATGHYARVSEDMHLLRGVDTEKDQSYFLWTLEKTDLEHVLFPVGDKDKSEIRKIAEKAGIPVAKKKDSQGVCFLGPIDMKDFLSHYIDEKKGDVLDEKGNIIGTHDGAIFYTIGERKGFNVPNIKSDNKALYVIAKDIEKNTITVSPDFHDVSKNTNERKIKLLKSNIRNEKYKDTVAQIRYRGEKYKVNLLDQDTVEFVDQIPAFDKGQSLVVYSKDVCLGGGIL